MQFKSVILGSAVAVFASSAFAHQYDPNKPVTLIGTVKKIEWRMPYVKIHLDAMNAKGKMTDWEIQTATPRVLQSGGITSTSINKGDQITVQGIQDRKKGSAHALAQSITLANGQTVAIGIAAPSQPTSEAQASQPAATLPPAQASQPATTLPPQPTAEASQPASAPPENVTSTPPPPFGPTGRASQPARALPHTATDWPLIGLMGLGALGAWSLLSISSARRRS